MTTTEYHNLLYRVSLCLERQQDQEDCKVVLKEVYEAMNYLHRYLNHTDLLDTGSGTRMEGFLFREPGEDLSGDVMFTLSEPWFNTIEKEWKYRKGSTIPVNEFQGNFRELAFENSPMRASMIILKRK